MKRDIFLFIKRIGWLFSVIFLFFATGVLADIPQRESDNLQEKITALLNDRDAGYGVTHTVTFKKTQQLHLTCPEPQITLPENHRLSGNLSVSVQCERKQFVQIELHASGSYWVARKMIPSGSTVTKQDIHLRNGDLSALPADVILAGENVTDSMAVRAIEPGQPLQHNQLRKPWKIKSGERVDVIFSGQGFHVRGRGRAMSNAAVSDTTRIRMDSGKLISGIVDDNGFINII